MTNTQNNTSMTRNAKRLLKDAVYAGGLAITRIPEGFTTRTEYRHAQSHLVREWTDSTLAELVVGGYVTAEWITPKIGVVTATPEGKDAFNRWAWNY